MAVYGKDFFGLALYGPTVAVDYAVDPFVALPYGYNSIRVSWKSPTGNWTGIRLLRSRSGYAASEVDGQILLDSTAPASDYVDSNLAPGCWHYYTLWLNTATGWVRVATASAMSVGDQGSKDVLWSRIPQYFRYITQDDRLALPAPYYYNAATVFNADTYQQENQHLKAFLQVLAWAVDYLKVLHQSVLWVYDPQRIDMERLTDLASTFGMDIVDSVPAQFLRNKVANATALARERGTVRGLEEEIGYDTGWQVDLYTSPNLMLNADQASFMNPVYPNWVPTVKYVTGSRVQYQGYVYQAQKQAIGQNQAPPQYPTTSNQWWSQINAGTSTNDETLRNPATGAITTWSVWEKGTIQQPALLRLAVTSPADSSLQNSNALQIYNPDSVDAGYHIWGSTNLTGTNDPLPHPDRVVREGLPIPVAYEWDPTVTYRIGDLAKYQGVAWKAVDQTLGQDPGTYPEKWRQVGVDERPLLGFSFYAHGPMTGTAGTGGQPVTPGMAFFDEHGVALRTVPTAYYSDGLFYDTFNSNPGSLNARVPDFRWPSLPASQSQWTVQSGTWTIWNNEGDDRVAFPASTGVVTVGMPGSRTAYKVAVTFAKAPASGRIQSLCLRYVDANNYFRITRTGADRVVSGVVTNLASWTAMKDGDRVTAQIDDSAGTFTVLVNGTAKATGLSFSGLTATSPYKHGMMVQ